MADSDTGPGRWLSTYATDARPGDLIRIGRYERRLIDRDYPDYACSRFHAVFQAGNESVGEYLGKLDRVEIFDERGDVAGRIAALAKGAL